MIPASSAHRAGKTAKKSSMYVKSPAMGCVLLLNQWRQPSRTIVRFERFNASGTMRDGEERTVFLGPPVGVKRTGIE